MSFQGGAERKWSYYTVEDDTTDWRAESFLERLAFGAQMFSLTLALAQLSSPLIALICDGAAATKMRSSTLNQK